ncbi:hypothetical protein GGH17_002370 [Coemansia sp. RSA 788]|nr:hypothetical protein GGH17_002370 [Coemansia sp. RSA 788]KAJ2165889.1 hypothetical protein GGH15_003098 [Coemansia sp. RSA 562]KAJ2195509.1 hypothetical protein GGH18_001901 [Coemansia sp. RSA 530]KAJ2281448.1 hypothetical protein GGH14_001981 [Coemansia sp. RSA 370]
MTTRRAQTPTQNRNLKGTVATPTQDALRRQSTNRVRKFRTNPLSVQLDLASKVGLTISDNMAENESVTEANKAHLQQMANDEYGSDDDLGDSEEAKAGKLHAQLIERLTSSNNKLDREWLEADRQDYEKRGMLLDQAVVTRRLKLLESFAQHLQKVGRNRASLLARLTEPLAEEHWMLDPAHHQRMVDVMQNMCGLVNRLPDISAAARHCAAGLTTIQETNSSAGSTNINSTRHIAQMERLVHEVEQAVEWLQTDHRSRDMLPKITH